MADHERGHILRSSSREDEFATAEQAPLTQHLSNQPSAFTESIGLDWAAAGRFSSRHHQFRHLFI